MKKVTTGKILRTAKRLNKGGKPWHFHILSPGCVFNKNKKFALILEDTEKKEQLVSLLLKKPSKTGQKLVEILHGKNVSQTAKGKQNKNLSSRVKLMISKAKELNLKGFAWHHHLLFPDCIFNKDARYWTLVFEDPLNGEVVEDRSSKEPTAALREIEPLFYLQKK